MLVWLFLEKGIGLDVEGQRKKLIHKRLWDRLVKEESVVVGLPMEDVLCLPRWVVGGDESGYPHLLGSLPHLRHWSLSIEVSQLLSVLSIEMT